MVIWLRVCEWRQGCLARVMTCVMTCVMTGVMTSVMTCPFIREYVANSKADFWEKFLGETSGFSRCEIECVDNWIGVM